MFQARDLSVKVLTQQEAMEAPLPLVACNVCNSTPGIPECGVTRMEVESRRDGLSLLRRQLRRELAELN